MYGMLNYIAYSQFLFYVWQMLILIVSIASVLIVLYIVIGLLLLSRAKRGEHVTL